MSRGGYHKLALAFSDPSEVEIPTRLEDWDEAFKERTGAYPVGSPLIGRLLCVGQCGGLARKQSNFCQLCWDQKFVPTDDVGTR